MFYSYSDLEELEFPLKYIFSGIYADRPRRFHLAFIGLKHIFIGLLRGSKNCCFRARARENKQSQHDILCYAGTSNQKLVINVIANGLGNRARIIAHPQHVRNPEREVSTTLFDEIIIMSLCLARSIEFLFFGVKTGKYSALYIIKTLRNIETHFRLEVIIKRAAPKAIILANDHNPDHRILLALARKYNIASIYLQHAHVTKLFPPLQMDYALLSGYASRDVYSSTQQTPWKLLNLPGQTQIKFIGVLPSIPRFVNKCNRKVAGLATNLTHDTDKISLVLSELESKNWKVIHRLHPRETRFIEGQTTTNVTTCSAPEVPIDEYLKSIDILFTCNSSITLQAALAGVPVYELPSLSPGVQPDYYEFVKNGISTKCTDIPYPESHYKIKQSPEALKYYSFTFGSAFYGNELELAVKYINEIITNA